MASTTALQVITGVAPIDIQAYARKKPFNNRPEAENSKALIFDLQ